MYTTPYLRQIYLHLPRCSALHHLLFSTRLLPTLFLGCLTTMLSANGCLGQDSSPDSVITQNGSSQPGILRRATVPPYAEIGVSYPLEPANGFAFTPHIGGLVQTRQGTPPPSTDCFVDLAVGALTYLPQPDLRIRDKSGADVTFQRSFQSERAMQGYGSPGLSPGWVHGYDVTITGAAPQPGTGWAGLKLVFPNGAQDRLLPQLDGQERPTGRFARKIGAPYQAVGKPSSAEGLWDSIEIRWQDGTVWQFNQFTSQLYTLNRIDNTNLIWDPTRRLTAVSDVLAQEPLFSFQYDASGRLSSVIDSMGNARTYRFDAPAGTGLTGRSLLRVSQIHPANTREAPDEWQYNYVQIANRPYLWSIATSASVGRRQKPYFISYMSGRTAKIIEPDGGQRVYMYSPGKTRFEHRDADENVALFWTQNLDKYGRNIGITDSNGHTAWINYP